MFDPNFKEENFMKRRERRTEMPEFVWTTSPPYTINVDPSYHNNMEILEQMVTDYRDSLNTNAAQLMYNALTQANTNPQNNNTNIQ